MTEKVIAQLFRQRMDENCIVIGWILDDDALHCIRLSVAISG